MAGPSFELPEIFTRRENKPNPFPGSQKKNTPLDNLPFQLPRKEYIGPAERRGPHTLKELTEVTGGGFFTPPHFQHLPPFLPPIGQTVPSRTLLTHSPTS